MRRQAYGKLLLCCSYSSIILGLSSVKFGIIILCRSMVLVFEPIFQIEWSIIQPKTIYGETSLHVSFFQLFIGIFLLMCLKKDFTVVRLIECHVLAPYFIVDFSFILGDS